MQVSSRFTIAVHILSCIDFFHKDNKITSEFLSASINVNPVIIRRILQMLKAANIVSISKGTGGAELVRKPKDVSLLDIFNAVSGVDEKGLFSFHEKPNKFCPVGGNIREALDGKLNLIQSAMERQMGQISLLDIVEDIKNKILLKIVQ